MAFILKKNDTRPALRAQLMQPDVNNGLNVAVELTLATGITFILGKKGSAAPKFEAPAIIEDAAAGKVMYVWSAGDTDTPGTWAGEFEVKWGTDTQTFPSDSYITIKIIEDLD